MKIVVCDDNATERNSCVEKLRVFSAEIHADVEIVTYDNGKTMLFELSSPENIPDIVYLDINMPEMNGVDVAEELRKRSFKGEIVFLTRSDKYWRNAFDLHAFHYIIKDDCPDSQFKSIFKSVVDAVNDRNSEYMVFSSCGDVVNVMICDIHYFEVRRNILIVYYEGGQFEFYSTLTKIAEQLMGRSFIQVHRSFLVSLSFIKKVTSETILLRDETEIPVGRKYVKQVKEAFAERWNLNGEKK